MTERKVIDWEAIEREYRVGQLSIREIASQFGVTHPGVLRKAKVEGWTRDLAKKVRERVADKLVTDVTVIASGKESVTVADVREEDIVEAAADRAIKVIQLHREDSKKQQDIIRRLMAILEERVKPENGNLTFDEVRNCGTVMRDCSQAFTKLVGIERQAHGIDDDGRRPIQIDEIIVTYVEATVEG